VLALNKDVAIVNYLLEWHKENRRRFPWREEKNPYKVLIAEFFLQRTPANRVASFLPTFLEEFPCPEKLANADLAHLEKLSLSMGLRKRISWLIESMKIICQKYNGKVPDTFGELILLPGVGEYTASAVLCFGFGQDVPIVDANIVRVYTRLFGLPKSHRTGDAEVKRIARGLLPNGLGPDYNEALLDFAATICRKNPLCEACPIKEFCCYYRKNQPTVT